MEINSKELGAKQMFDQSIIYLYNSYREDGLSKEEASKLVTGEVEKIYQKYSSMGMASEKSSILSNPLTTIDEVMQQLKRFDWDSWRSRPVIEKELAIKNVHNAIYRKLDGVKRLLK